VVGESAPARPWAHWRFWRSPPDQPRWARPALLAIAATAALAYGDGMGSVTLEPFYGAAARSMSESWHNFFFGAVDPWGTVSVDKLPGTLWVQALSLRLFGFHLWAIVLPQVVEGTLTVLVIYRALRRVSGPGAGLVAATVLALSPGTVLLNRGNISDSLLILLLVLAADATTRAIVEGRLPSLLMAGLWVGLAFQAKMIQAWLVLPALYLAYLVAAPTARLFRRSGHVLLASLVVVVVSLSWMTAVSAIPAHDRPYVDGSCDDSLYSQVFLYNGLERLSGNELQAPGCSRPSEFLIDAARLGAVAGVGTFAVPSGWDRLLEGVFGRDDAWLLVPAVVAAGALLVGRRRRPRTDPIGAATILWTTWLVVTGAFFSGGRYLNSYYVAALMPPMAALCGMGAVLAWRHRRSAVTRAVLLTTVVTSTAYAIFLLPATTGVRVAIMASTITVAALAVGILLVSLRRQHASVWSISVGLGLSAIALLISSAWATTTVLVTGEGPFDTPYQPAQVTFYSQTVPTLDKADWPAMVKFAATFPPNHAVDAMETSGDAGYNIMVTGHEFLPVGGFTGVVPAPTVPQFTRDVAEGRVTRVLVASSPPTSNPVMVWVTRNCAKQTYGESTVTHDDATFQRYLCSPADAGGKGR
jgi:4-amino-4-deoxy-L-arabinose transferase-like glycosyltransferase